MPQALGLTVEPPVETTWLLLITLPVPTTKNPILVFPSARISSIRWPEEAVKGEMSSSHIPKRNPRMVPFLMVMFFLWSAKMPMPG
jgi:hypothetical protein